MLKFELMYLPEMLVDMDQVHFYISLIYCTSVVILSPLYLWHWCSHTCRVKLSVKAFSRGPIHFPPLQAILMEGHDENEAKEEALKKFYLCSKRN